MRLAREPLALPHNMSRPQCSLQSAGSLFRQARGAGQGADAIWLAPADSAKVCAPIHAAPLCLPLPPLRALANSAPRPVAYLVVVVEVRFAGRGKHTRAGENTLGQAALITLH